MEVVVVNLLLLYLLVPPLFIDLNLNEQQEIIKKTIFLYRRPLVK